jgi:hypothetical protein
VVDEAGVRLGSVGLLRWKDIEAVEVLEPQTMRGLRIQPRSRLRLRLAELPSGWARVQKGAPRVVIPVVDRERDLLRSIEQRLAFAT